MRKFVRIENSASGAWLCTTAPGSPPAGARNLTTARLSGEKGCPDARPGRADARITTYSTNEKNMRNPVDRHGQIMYDLAVIEPGLIPNGSPNRSAGNESSLNQHMHVHVTVLHPHSDEGGRLLVDGLENQYDPVDPVRTRAYRACARTVIQN